MAEELIIRLDGREATAGILPLSDLAVSLSGWEQLLRLVAELNIRRETSVPSNLPDYPLRDEVRIEVRALRQGSFMVVIGVYFLNSFLGNAPWEFTRLMGRKFWSLLKGVKQSYLEAKEESETLEMAAMRHAALLSYIEDPDDRLRESVHMVEQLDQAATSATLPITRSADSITVEDTSSGESLVWTPKDRRLCATPFHVAKPLIIPEGMPELRRIHIIQVNVNNGWGRFEFEEPRDAQEANQQECHVVDRRLRKTRDPYTGSEHRRSAIDVWLKRVTRVESPTLSHFWEIYGTETKDPERLF